MSQHVKYPNVPKLSIWGPCITDPDGSATVFNTALSKGHSGDLRGAYLDLFRYSYNVHTRQCNSAEVQARNFALLVHIAALMNNWVLAHTLDQEVRALMPLSWQEAYSHQELVDMVMDLASLAVRDQDALFSGSNRSEGYHISGTTIVLIIVAILALQAVVLFV